MKIKKPNEYGEFKVNNKIIPYSLFSSCFYCDGEITFWNENKDVELGFVVEKDKKTANMIMQNFVKSAPANGRCVILEV